MTGSSIRVLKTRSLCHATSGTARTRAGVRSTCTVALPLLHAPGHIHVSPMEERLREDRMRKQTMTVLSFLLAVALLLAPTTAVLAWGPSGSSGSGGGSGSGSSGSGAAAGAPSGAGAPA